MKRKRFCGQTNMITELYETKQVLSLCETLLVRRGEKCWVTVVYTVSQNLRIFSIEHAVGALLSNMILGKQAGQ